MAEVNDKGEVTVEGQFVGRLEGFRFHQDDSATGDEAKTLKAAATAALQPEFHLRADRFYNAPDTEMDFTEQGGLMWGEHAIGKLVTGDDPLKPRAVAFVDEEAGSDVADKVQRRLQHFIDRKVASLFEPMIGIQKDEALTGMAKGFGFRMIEAMGVIDRREVAEEVKGLDQDARGLLRKHGIRFGQFTIFMPLLLKPAPTRLRLVLQSLASGADEFPQSPPPGLVTIPYLKEIPAQTYLMSGYKPAGERAIRIDMLERLADLLRAQDSRGGFEANPDMLSITGMTLDQFANLMEGLGYKAERGEREKSQRALDAASEGEATSSEPTVETPQDGSVAEPTAAPTGEDDKREAEATDDAPQDTVAQEDTTEVFYTFKWGGAQRGGGQRRGKPQGKRDGGKPQGKGKRPRDGDRGKTRSFEAKPPRKEKKIDPDNPFAQALMGLKVKDD